MDVKAYLLSAKELFHYYNNEVSALEETIKILKACEESCTSQITDMPKGSDMSDKTDATVSRIMMEDKLSSKKKEKTLIIFMANDIINTLPDAIQRTILLKYYLSNKTWKMVAKDVGYCYSRCQEIHNSGIKYLRKNYKLK